MDTMWWVERCGLPLHLIVYNTRSDILRLLTDTLRGRVESVDVDYRATPECLPVDREVAVRARRRAQDGSFLPGHVQHRDDSKLSVCDVSCGTFLCNVILFPRLISSAILIRKALKGEGVQ